MFRLGRANRRCPMKHVTRERLIALLARALLTLVGARKATADGFDDCKPVGRRCRTNQSCCGGRCVKTAAAKFGNCCTPSTCAAQGKDCGTISDGCGGMLDCGSCTAPETCGGGGTPNVCGTTTLPPPCPGISVPPQECGSGPPGSCRCVALCDHGCAPGCVDVTAAGPDCMMTDAECTPMFPFCIGIGCGPNICIIPEFSPLCLRSCPTP